MQSRNIITYQGITIVTICLEMNRLLGHCLRYWLLTKCGA